MQGDFVLFGGYMECTDWSVPITVVLAKYKTMSELVKMREQSFAQTGPCIDAVPPHPRPHPGQRPPPRDQWERPDSMLLSTGQI